MTTLTEPSRHAVPAFRMEVRIAEAIRKFARWAELRSARRSLEAMPDGMLADIGISRSAIDHASAFGRDLIKDR